MSDKKISELEGVNSVLPTDLIPLVRLGEPNVNYKITSASFFNNLQISGSNIIGSASIQPSILGSNPTSNTFLNGNKEYKPVVQSLKSTNQSINLRGSLTNGVYQNEVDISINTTKLGATKQVLSPSGTTQIINFDNGSFIELNLSNASGNVTLTLQNPLTMTYLIYVNQGSNARNLIFPVGTLQAGAKGNTYAGTSSTKDLLAVTYTGSIYLINSVSNYA